jgi:hypothetical protein
MHFSECISVVKQNMTVYATINFVIAKGMEIRINIRQTKNKKEA